MDVPCYKCERRTISCHDTCTEYKRYDAERKAIHKKRQAERLADVPIYSGFGYLAEVLNRKTR